MEKLLDFLENSKKYMKFKKYKKKSKEDAKKWNKTMGKSNVKDKKKDKSAKRTLRLSASSVGERGTRPLNVPQRKKERKPCKSLGVTQNHVNLVKKNPMLVRNALISQPLWQVSLMNL